MEQHGKNNSLLAKNTLMLYIRMFLTMAISLYTSRVVLKELGVNDYGLYNVISGLVVMMTFLNGAMTIASQRFIATEIGKLKGSLTQIFSHVFYAHLFIAIIVIIIAETIGLWFVYNKMIIPRIMLNQAFWVYQCSIVVFISSILATPYNAAILAYEKMEIYAYVSLFTVIGKLLVAYSLIFFTSHKLLLYSFEILIMSILSDWICIIYSHRHFTLCRITRKFNSLVFKEISSFAGWSIFGAIAWAAKNQGLNVLLNLFFSSAINAAYGVTNQVNTAINSFVQNFNIAVNPQIFKSYVSNDFRRLLNLINFGGKVSFLLFWLIAFPVYLRIDPILTFWLTDVPPHTSNFIRLVLIVSLLESFSYSLGTSIQATGKIKLYQILVGITIFLNIPVSYFFLKNGYPCEIVLIVSIFMATITLVERLILVKRQIKNFSIRGYFNAVILKSLYVVISSVLLVGLINKTVVIDLWWLNLILDIIITSFPIWLLGMTRDERAKIIFFIKRRIKING